jgi:hypothetical protein
VDAQNQPDSQSDIERQEMAGKAAQRWSELSPQAKTAIVAGAALDAGLRAWALLGLLSTFGVAPAAYLLLGRKS